MSGLFPTLHNSSDPPPQYFRQPSNPPSPGSRVDSPPRLLFVPHPPLTHSSETRAMQFSPSDRKAVSIHLVMSANRLNDGYPGLPPLTVTTPGWKLVRSLARLVAETRLVVSLQGQVGEMRSRDRERYGIDSLIFN